MTFTSLKRYPGIRRRVGWGMVVLWLFLLTTYFTYLSSHATQSGAKLREVRFLPVELRAMAGANTGASLFVALHPRCPCSRSTMSELARSLGRSRVRPKPVCLMFRPADAPDSWIDGWLRGAAEESGYSVVIDPEGRLAGQLGMITSGHVVLFDEAGHLQFSGGITESRGHEGDNQGSRELINALRESGRGVVSTPVFGCSLNSCTEPRSVNE